MPLVLNSSSITGLAAVGGLSARQTGEVLQVVQYIYSSASSTTSTSYVATSLTNSITPQFSSSKILVIVNCGTTYQSTSATSALTIYKNNTTDLAPTARGFGLSSYTGNMPVSFSYLDSPTTTSSTTYTVYMRTNGGTAYLGGSDGGVYTSSSITLMEIAA